MSVYTYKDMAKAMELQKKEGKKDRYMEITRTLLDVDYCSMDFGEQKEYLAVLQETLSHMDFQIYELYRALRDRSLELEHLLQGNEEETVFSLPEEWKEKLSLKVLFSTARSATVEIADGGLYHTRKNYGIIVNGKKSGMADTVVTGVFHLEPDSDNEIVITDEEEKCFGHILVHTEKEFVTLDVQQFGAKGDGAADDTKAIQAAILACPKDGRVLIPAGKYCITSIFLKSNVKLELEEGTELCGIEDHSAYPVFPGMIPSTDGKDEYNLGTWEGNPLPMYAGLITGIDVENVVIYGKGVINGNASKKDWWNEPKKMKDAYRPRLVFLSHCKNVTLQGITLQNSPSWTIHPYFSEELGFYNITVSNPFDSPNTDGLDPESCKNVVAAGVKFSLGDDCIAVKSGKIYMGRKYKRPSENIVITHCLMENGHGAVTIGSEMSGGVRNLVVENCAFHNTDRGLRIKTRRGRGRDAILDEIIFRNIEMNHVMTPFVVNTFYFCDPDGKTPYVQSREPYPADERTPDVRRLVFEDIVAENCHVAGAYIEGLPEKKIEEIQMKNVKIAYAPEAKCDVPAMSEGVEPCSRRGIFVKNVKKLLLDGVEICGQEGEAVVSEAVDDMEKR